ncbi:MAG TPA: hypothetical protein VG816_13765 [Solirubrobacterales bacterium]|nr:hypothetical protein [Solirubrobacterales bacterium]
MPAKIAPLSLLVVGRDAELTHELPPTREAVAVNRDARVSHRSATGAVNDLTLPLEPAPSGSRVVERLQGERQRRDLLGVEVVPLNNGAEQPFCLGAEVAGRGR